MDNHVKDQEIIRALNRLVSHYGYQDWWEDRNRLSDWISMILIQQTTENNAQLALDNLKDYLNLESLLDISMEDLESLIRPAGFYRQKARYIKELMTWFANHGGNLNKFQDYRTEALRKELLMIKGVGQETADAMLLYIFDRKVFICDQYAMRLFRRMAWGDYQSYLEMRKAVAHLVQDIPLKVCKEWHACIDEHGKHFRKDPQMDESWLLQEK